MPGRRWPRRTGVPHGRMRSAKRTLLILLVLLITAAAAASAMIFRSLLTELAVSEARDVVITSINSIVKDIMHDGETAPRLVALEKDGEGKVTAITTNVAEVNTLAAEILEMAADKTSANVVTVSIPLGNLTGNAFLLNKGPAVPVDVEMLSSSVAGFRSELTGAGINQTRHQILLDITVDVSLLMPWRSVGTSVDTEVLVSETVIVGQVPNSYMNWERTS